MHATVSHNEIDTESTGDYKRTWSKISNNASRHIHIIYDVKAHVVYITYKTLTYYNSLLSLIKY
jgi:hypothetical protein